MMTDFINDNCRQHKWIVEACGCDRCIKDRDTKRLLLMDKLSAVFVRDYTDRIAIEHNNEAMSAGMGGGRQNVGMV